MCSDTTESPKNDLEWWFALHANFHVMSSSSFSRRILCMGTPGKGTINDCSTERTYEERDSAPFNIESGFRLKCVVVRFREV